MDLQGWTLAAAVGLGITAAPADSGPPQHTPEADVGIVAAAPDSRATGYVRELAELINAYRARHGLRPLALVPELNTLAVEHSAKMAHARRLSHDGFRDRFDRTDARICVENVGVNFVHPQAQLAGWQASPGHHRNLLEPKVARMGLANARSFVTFFACG